MGDLIVRVADADVKWSRHETVVSTIRHCGPTIWLTLVTPIDRNFVDPDTPSSADAESVGGVCGVVAAQSDSAPADVRERTTTETVTPATLARHWAFRRRRKRDKTARN